MSESKIESCKLIVLWILKDRFNKTIPSMTKEQILNTFTTKEKKKAIKKAIEILVKENKILEFKWTRSKTLNYIINGEVLNK